MMVVTVVAAILATAIAVFKHRDESPAPSPRPNEISQKMQEPIPTHLGAELGLTQAWQALSDWQNGPALPNAPASAISVKLLFELEGATSSPSYLVDIKRGNSRKNQLWELPGGRLDAGEGVLATLQRELSEEDPSGALRQALDRLIAGHSPELVYKVLPVGHDELVYLFKAPLAASEWLAVKAYWQKPHPQHAELYGFSVLPQSALDSRVKEQRRQWTPKSRKILKSLRRYSSAAETDAP